MSVRTRRVAGLDGVDLKDATFVRRVFPAHFHETWSLGVVRSGMEKMRFRGSDAVVLRGRVVVLAPGEVHAHAAFDDAPWTYQAVYVSPDLVASRARALGIAEHAAIDPVVDDEALARALERVHASPAQAARERLVRAVDALLMRHARSAPRPAIAAVALQEAAEYLRSATEKVPLSALAARFRRDPQKLARAFRRAHGLTPAAYQVVHRINRARALLASGMPIAEAAIATGFYDQSHLVRHFKRYTGTTPSEYRRADAQ